jgi:sugar lactone lactonase YvrE
MFSPDALFHVPSRHHGNNQRVPGEGILPAQPSGDHAPDAEAPPWMLLTNERVVENREPPAHALAVGTASSPAAQVRNQTVTFLYGRPSVISSPRYVVTDSQRRVILSDPEGLAVHVLDPLGKTSFRLACGNGYRVRRPAGVAADAEDNLYVVDSELGMVAVFDSGGRFMRYIGTYHGEPDYASPRGIAIDKRKQRLYLVDTPRNQMFELDLSGRVVKRFGKNRRGEGVGELEAPTDVALNGERIVVLDRWGTRVQVLNTRFDTLYSFSVGRLGDPQFSRENGPGTDGEGHIFASSFRRGVVSMYSPQGHLMAMFGQSGTRAGEFGAPGGLWIDAQNHMFIAESANGRVQMFQLHYGEASETVAGGEKVPQSSGSGQVLADTTGVYH